MAKKENIEVFYPTTIKTWRSWLEKNHLSKQAVWLVFYKKASAKKSLTWSEAVDVALCFGWIDSKKIKIDEIKSHQYFSKRKPKSTWSRINKEKVQQLIEKGLMMPAGYDSIDTAKQNGSWTLMDAVEELIIPADLELEFKNHEGAKDFFLSLSKSARKMILYWVISAKRPGTRNNRIAQIAELAGKGEKPKFLG